MRLCHSISIRMQGPTVQKKDGVHQKYIGLIRKLKVASDCPKGKISMSANPRCFIAIDAKNKTSKTQNGQRHQCGEEWVKSQ